VRLFASAREAAGRGYDEIDGTTLGEVLAAARTRYGDTFSAVLARARVWVNGQPADDATPVGDQDVIAVLPPVSGGAAPREAADAEPGTVSGAPAPESVPGSAGERSPRLRFAPGPPPELPARVRAAPVDGALARRVEPLASPAPAPLPRRPLVVVPDVDRPHVRLGLAWAVCTALVTWAGELPLALWFAAAAALAAAQAVRAWRRRGEHPSTLVAVAGAAALPLAALGGVHTITPVVAATIAASLLSRLWLPAPRAVRCLGLTYLIALPIGLAAASPVLLRDIGLAAPYVLLGMVALYDAGAYIVGTGASAAWEGPAAGVAALVPITIVVAVVLVPPFRGASPLLLGLVAAGLAPLGPLAGSMVLGDRAAYAPALRRLDSLLLLGPVWAWVAVALIRR